MQLNAILAEALDRGITREDALYLFQEVRDWEQVLRLFEVASRVRDQEVGRKVRLMGFIASITRCTVYPPCGYCFRWASPEAFTSKDLLSGEELAIAARAVERAGITRVEIAGGTLWGDEGSHATLRTVEVVTEASELKVWINNGPSFTPADPFKFKELGAEGIGCGLETINAHLYRDLRPGDSLQRRKEIVEATEQAGLGIDNTLMIGLGERWEQDHPYGDWVDFLFYFKQFENFRILEAHPFRPQPGSPVEDLPAGSSFEAAKAKAIARLIFRDIDIAGADEVIGIMAGANMIMHAVTVMKKGRGGPGARCGSSGIEQIGDDLVLANYLPAISRYLKELQMELE